MQQWLLTLIVLSFSRRNIFILNKFLISRKILITCRELYFEVVGHVIPLEWDIFLKMRFLLSKIMSKMTHIHNKNKNNCFQICAADSFKLKKGIRNCIIFHWHFAKPCISGRPINRVHRALLVFELPI